MASMIRRRIAVYGIVQGVGFRPFVKLTADRFGITGTVANKGSYVEIYAQASETALKQFLRALQDEAPERSAILKVEVHETEHRTASSFNILESEEEEGDIFVSPDIAICSRCRKELFDPNDRRYMHPFINCTACGPRLTILDAMPYDRERTSMKKFPMCPDCEAEYTDPATRRYHAQPVCCNECGPEVYLLGREERGRDAIMKVRKTLHDGGIVAVKGIGGFHIACDAKNEEAVRELRRRKGRPEKPLAVMFRDLAAAHEACELGEKEEKLLDGPQHPILLLPKRNPNGIASSVTRENPNLGVMLPYAPLQLLLFDYNDGFDLGTNALVMTSGNVSGAPICRTDEDAARELAPFVDLILSHNRDILIRADDSVVDLYRGEPYMIRRSRGYAPLPFMMTERTEGRVLGIGADLKNSFCLAKNELFYLSPYIGDMADPRTLDAARSSLGRMEELLRIEPELVVADLHPRYFSGELAEVQKIPILRIQHHYAHVLACMAENDISPEEKVLGIALDGTGYGEDGTIWGGEILAADYRSFKRCAHLKPFTQIGGDLSAKEGWRIAVDLINDLYGNRAGEVVQALGITSEGTAALFQRMKERGISSVRSTSAGRLFDAVSAILGLRRSSTFEGEAAMALQFAAEAYAKRPGEASFHPLDEEGFLAELQIADDVSTEEPEVPRTEDVLGEESPAVLRTDLLVKELIDRRLRGEDASSLAWLFHAALALMLADAAAEAATRLGVRKVALTGGVYQNTLLLERTEKELEVRGLAVLRHHLVPPNDGGIALGQAVYGMYAWKDLRDSS